MRVLALLDQKSGIVLTSAHAPVDTPPFRNISGKPTRTKPATHTKRKATTAKVQRTITDSIRRTEYALAHTVSRCLGARSTTVARCGRCNRDRTYSSTDEPDIQQASL
jgi:hypothetical protein